MGDFPLSPRDGAVCRGGAGQVGEGAGGPCQVRPPAQSSSHVVRQPVLQRCQERSPRGPEWSDTHLGAWGEE